MPMAASVFSIHNLLAYAELAVAVLALIFLLHAIYNVYLHPLHSYPGPKAWAATRLVWTYYDIRGELTLEIRKLHDQYGPVIRIAPNELSYITANAWKDIYSHRDVEMEKNLVGAGIPPPMFDEGPGLANSNHQDHVRMRKLISPAFSDRALREQEPYLQTYVDQLISGLRREGSKGAQNMVHWLNWASFDIIGDLTCGEPFGSLQKAEYDPWVANIFFALKGITWLHISLHYKIMPLLQIITLKHLMKAYDDTVALAHEKVDRRLTKTEDRKDFLSYILRHSDERGLSRREIYINAAHIIVAGSETTATLLSGAIYHLLRNGHVYSKLVRLVRQTFANESSITIQKTAELEYLHLVLEESLRIYPPAAVSMPRIVPGKGALIDGRWVPGGVTVGVHQWSTYHSPLNFHDPEAFVPERWTEASNPSSPFAKDNKAAFQPFSFGPRNCIGKR